MELQEISKGVFVKKASAQVAGAQSGRLAEKAGPFRDDSELQTACQEEWRRNPALRQEFSSLDQYTAFRKAEAGGQVRIFGEQRVTRG